MAFMADDFQHRCTTGAMLFMIMVVVVVMGGGDDDDDNVDVVSKGR